MGTSLPPSIDLLVGGTVNVASVKTSLTFASHAGINKATLTPIPFSLTRDFETRNPKHLVRIRPQFFNSV